MACTNKVCKTVEWGAYSLGVQISREERTFQVNMLVEWCVLIMIASLREEHTFRVNMFVEWCVLIRCASL